MAYGNSGTAIGQYIPDTPGTTPRQPVISGQMQALEQRTETLNQLVAELEARISAVLQPELPAVKESAQTSPPMPSVALGAGIAQMNERLGMTAQRLRHIIERVEL